MSLCAARTNRTAANHFKIRSFVSSVIVSASMTCGLALLLAFLIGVIAGLRSFTAPAVVCWAAHLGWINLHGSPLSFMGSTAAAIIFTIFALVELTADKLPKTPSRTTPFPLTVRVIFGALSGAALGVAGGQSLALGAVLGGIGAVAGAFAGYETRQRIVAASKLPDFPIALLGRCGRDRRRPANCFSVLTSSAQEFWPRAIRARQYCLAVAKHRNRCAGDWLYHPRETRECHRCLRSVPAHGNAPALSGRCSSYVAVICVMGEL